MLHDALAVLAVAALTGGWVLFQRWITRMDPELPGIKRSCSGCPTPDSPACREDCELRPHCRTDHGSREAKPMKI